MAKSKDRSELLSRNDGAFTSLVLRYLDGVADASEIESLEWLIGNNESQRELFAATCVRCCEVEAAVSTRICSAELFGASKDLGEAQSIKLLDGQEILRSIRVRQKEERVTVSGPRPADCSVAGQKRVWLLCLSTAATLACILSLGKYYFLDSSQLGDHSAPVAAVIHDSFNPIWSEEGVAITEETRLHFGAHFTLIEGFLELSMKRGARVLLEAPIEVELVNDNRLRLVSGKLVAKVPKQAREFTVVSPVAEVIDLGTEFGVEVAPESGKTTAAVFEGIVNLRELSEKRTTTQSLKLTAGRQGSVSALGALSTGSSLYDESSLAFNQKIPQPSYIATVLSKRPVLYHRFEAAKETRSFNLVDPRRYVAQLDGNVSSVPSGPQIGSLDGVNSALRFEDPGGGVEIASGLESLASSEAYSIMAWIRLDALTTQNIVLGTNEKGPEWNFGPQIRVRDDGTLEHYLFCPPPKGSGRPIGWKYIQASSAKLAVDRWYHVAINASSNGVMQLYINGEKASRDKPIDHPIVTQYPRLIIGCSSGMFQETVHHMGSFLGSIDELAVFRRCLAPEEIKKIFMSASWRGGEL